MKNKVKLIYSDNVINSFIFYFQQEDQMKKKKN